MSAAAFGARLKLQEAIIELQVYKEMRNLRLPKGPSRMNLSSHCGGTSIQILRPSRIVFYDS